MKGMDVDRLDLRPNCETGLSLRMILIPGLIVDSFSNCCLDSLRISIYNKALLAFLTTLKNLPKQTQCLPGFLSAAPRRGQAYNRRSLNVC